MTLRQNLADTIALLAGAVVGKLAFDLVGALAFDTDFAALFTSPGLWIVALLITASYVLVFRTLPRLAAIFVAFFLGTILAWLFFGLFAESGPLWSSLVFLAGLFAAASLATFAAVRTTAQRPKSGPESASPKA